MMPPSVVPLLLPLLLPLLVPLLLPLLLPLELPVPLLLPPLDDAPPSLEPPPPPLLLLLQAMAVAMAVMARVPRATKVRVRMGRKRARSPPARRHTCVNAGYILRSSR
jgi:hypothetical protein